MLISDEARFLPDNESAATHAALQTIGWGVILLDRESMVRYANPTAQRELSHGAALKYFQGQLTAREDSQAQAMRSAMANARSGERCMTRLGLGPNARMMAFVPLQVGQPALDSAQTPAEVQRILVIWAADDLPLQFTMCLFARATGLTSSEREVLQELCKGYQAQEIALRRAVKLSTVRSQICSIRNKLGARSIYEVIAGTLLVPPLSPMLHR